MSRTRRAAFTLTELLVVVAVLAVLASLLLPGVMLVKSLAKTAHCSSNLRHISAALYAYLGEQSSLPTGWTVGTGYVSWDDLLSSYDGRELADSGSGAMTMNAARLYTATGDPASMKAFRIYVCPAETARYPGDPANTPILEQTRFLRTYAMNRAWTGVAGATIDHGVQGLYAKNSTGADWTAPWSSVRRPADTILLAEMRYIWNRLGSDLGAVVDNPNSTGTTNSPANLVGQVLLSGGIGNRAPLHRLRWNYLFCDGHVELLAPEQTLSAGAATTGAPDALSRWVR